MTRSPNSHGATAPKRNTLITLCVVALLCSIVLIYRLTQVDTVNLPGSLAGHPALGEPIQADESDLLFASSLPAQIVLQLSDADAQKLREEARAYVQCQLCENVGEPLVVGLKLKGAAGSFRELDDRPAFTVNVNKYRKQQRFHRLEKFYLNNSVQDESYYSEWLCASICKQLSLPSPRIAFAHVWLNERDLGLYVLKEGFDESFLARHFQDGSGSLYDGGFLQDIDIDLEKDTGSDRDDLGDLIRLRDACTLADSQERRAAVASSLDLDAFLTFMAFEMMAGHWDGYVANQNNYRLYIPSSGRAWFLPHGMDQMFQDTEYSVFEPRATIVTRAVREQADWNELYRERVRQILPIFEPQRLIAALEELERCLRPELLKIDPDCGAAREELLNQWRERLTRRYASIAEQLEQPDPPPHFDDSADDEPMRLAIGESIELGDFYDRQETPESILSLMEGEPTIYRIEVGDADDCVASWRRTIRLPPGKYRLAADFRGESIEPRLSDDRGVGAGVRISGVNRAEGLIGTADWQTLSHDFNLIGGSESPTEMSVEPDMDEPMSQVELVCELRATEGWSEMRSATLTRLPD